jgi:hypothetical protein
MMFWGVFRILQQACSMASCTANLAAASSSAASLKFGLCFAFGAFWTLAA